MTYASFTRTRVPFLKFREADARINVAIIVRSAHHDLRGIACRTPEVSADPGWREK